MPKAPELARRLTFLELTDEDFTALARLRPVLEKVADDFVAAFYRHLLSFDELHGLLADTEVRDRLLRAQREYLLSLTDETIEDQLVEERLRIGRMHARLDLSPSWYFGAYQIYISRLTRLVDEEMGGDPEQRERIKQTLFKRLLLDMQLATESYVEARHGQLSFMNRELADAQRGLSREVDEQAVELRETHERARAAEQLASVGTLAAGLAHEIGTPMGVIRGHAESLEGSVSNEKNRWRAHTIVEQIDRITNIMHALLNLARPRAPVEEPVALGDVITTASSFLGDKFVRRGIEVQSEFAPVPALRGDPEKLQQLFLNLMLNAADAMPEGGTLTLRLAAPSDREIVATVADTGVGIEAGELERIFQPFMTTKEAGRGSGLGLVVAKGIVLDHHGDIQVASEPGRGTRFDISFPVR